VRISRSFWIPDLQQAWKISSIHIEEGELVWQDVIAEFYEPFAKNLAKAHEELEKIEIQDEESDVVCEKCGRNMVINLVALVSF